VTLILGHSVFIVLVVLNSRGLKYIYILTTANKLCKHAKAV